MTNHTEPQKDAPEEIVVWAEPGGPVMLKAVSPFGDPVELNANEARQLAALLLELAKRCDSTV